jgi:hypothetical protein
VASTQGPAEPDVSDNSPMFLGDQALAPVMAQRRPKVGHANPVGRIDLPERRCEHASHGLHIGWPFGTYRESHATDAATQRQGAANDKWSARARADPAGALRRHAGPRSVHRTG